VMVFAPRQKSRRRRWDGLNPAKSDRTGGVTPGYFVLRYGPPYHRHTTRPRYAAGRRRAFKSPQNMTISRTDPFPVIAKTAARNKKNNVRNFMVT